MSDSLTMRREEMEIEGGRTLYVYVFEEAPSESGDGG